MLGLVTHAVGAPLDLTASSQNRSSVEKKNDEQETWKDINYILPLCKQTEISGSERLILSSSSDLCSK